MGGTLVSGSAGLSNEEASDWAMIFSASSTVKNVLNGALRRLKKEILGRGIEATR